MRFSVISTTFYLALSVSARPQLGGFLSGLTGQSESLNDNKLLNGGGDNYFPPPPADTSIEQATASCGSHTSLSCCNEANTSGDAVSEASGILAGLLGGLGGVGSSGGLGLFSGCSTLDVAAAAGLSGLLNSQCKQTAACCQNIKNGGQSGLINVGIPCVAISGLL